MALSTQEEQWNKKGHFLMALDPSKFGDSQIFQQKVREYLRYVEDGLPATEGSKIRIPGHGGHARRSEFLKEGIPVCGDAPWIWLRD